MVQLGRNELAVVLLVELTNIARSISIAVSYLNINQVFFVWNFTKMLQIIFRGKDQSVETRLDDVSIEANNDKWIYIP